MPTLKTVCGIKISRATDETLWESRKVALRQLSDYVDVPHIMIVLSKFDTRVLYKANWSRGTLLSESKRIRLITTGHEVHEGCPFHVEAIRYIRFAATLADKEESEEVTNSHLLEALDPYITQIRRDPNKR